MGTQAQEAPAHPEGPRASSPSPEAPCPLHFSSRTRPAPLSALSAPLLLTHTDPPAYPCPLGALSPRCQPRWSLTKGKSRRLLLQPGPTLPNSLLNLSRVASGLDASPTLRVRGAQEQDEAGIGGTGIRSWTPPAHEAGTSTPQRCPRQPWPGWAGGARAGSGRAAQLLGCA